MAILDVVVPQLGEGLQEVLVQKLLKKPGELVERDEPIYIMETDKADVEVESPYAGTLKEWLVEEGKVLAVGALIARIESTASMAVVNPSESRSAGTPVVPAEIGISSIERESTLINGSASLPSRASVFFSSVFYTSLRIRACLDSKLLR